jgi:hypothetical protein
MRHPCWAICASWQRCCVSIRPLVSVDLARLEDGIWEVVEVGDGQVSGLREMDPRAFFRALRSALDSNL